MNRNKYAERSGIMDLSNEKKRIAIISIYYKSCNFGGNLQAYALAAYLNKQGYSAEQICHYELKRAKLVDMLLHRPHKFVAKAVRRVVRKPYELIKSRKIRALDERYRISQRRVEAFEDFNQNVIPHSKGVYNIENISSIVDEYDAFITGSDQVWNLNWYNPVFFLDFVPSEKTKLSYAASLAMDKLTPSQRETVKKSLKDFKAVSVREENAVGLLEGLSPLPAEFVVDPTLLLTSEQWDEICSERRVEQEYVLCYFLGENSRSRALAREFADKNGLKLVSIPHAGGEIKLCDECFGDEQIYDASPKDFLSLVKYASYVFTDSFHAVVFSNIYQRQYFVFNRNAKSELSSRIYSITSLFGSEERFCHGSERESMSYVEGLAPIDYTKRNTSFEKLKAHSENFLKNNLEQ
ncbi:MAG: polysaccharide pyruvyl transferase family protein [Clostridia bacterium]|nr:polysaccharide pyruvyl transferase family protein [Clostridia bacterium]